MKRLNIYYVVSTIALAFMMLIMARTLEVTGWFGKQSGKSPAQMLLQKLEGVFTLNHNGSDAIYTDKQFMIRSMDSLGRGWLEVTLDTLVYLRLKISDFEDEQVLIEIFKPDSLGSVYKLEACELLIERDEAGKWFGSTLGTFCGVNSDEHEYFELRLAVDSEIGLEIENRRFDDQVLLTKRDYILKRLADDE
ncbi:MAG: hypothetical protein K9N35_04880 [Candidatus Marinimicrobia bacterium]|nr:hypothetical protein [Candidatus Neomarinimicrobiota bacterium]